MAYGAHHLFNAGHGSIREAARLGAARSSARSFKAPAQPHAPHPWTSHYFLLSLSQLPFHLLQRESNESFACWCLPASAVAIGGLGVRCACPPFCLFAVFAPQLGERLLCISILPLQRCTKASLSLMISQKLSRRLSSDALGYSCPQDHVYHNLFCSNSYKLDLKWSAKPTVPTAHCPLPSAQTTTPQLLTSRPSPSPFNNRLKPVWIRPPGQRWNPETVEVFVSPLWVPLLPGTISGAHGQDIEWHVGVQK